MSVVSTIVVFHLFYHCLIRVVGCCIICCKDSLVIPVVSRLMAAALTLVTPVLIFLVYIPKVRILVAEVDQGLANVNSQMGDNGM